jgi:hypothetical protein
MIYYVSTKYALRLALGALRRFLCALYGSR